MENRARRAWLFELAIVAAAALIALISARPYAASWNDGSRLATVESLVDRGTLAIDDSIFLAVPHDEDRSPYPHHDLLLNTHGTLDKLFIEGHYYSDKSPLPSLWMAGVYQVVQWLTGLTASDHPRLFCYLMTLSSSGLAYVLAVWCVWRMTRAAGLTLAGRAAALIPAVFALGSLAVPYTRHVNHHVMLLAVSAGAWLLIMGLEQGKQAPPRIGGLGFLAGLGWAFDFGVGPLMLATLFTLVLWRCRRLATVIVFLLAAAPPIAAHHTVNFAIGGTMLPANTVADYFRWPGSPFNPDNLTGAWHHDSLGRFIAYSLGIMFAKRGFLGHSLPVFLALAKLGVLWRLKPRLRPELLAAAGFCLGVWLLYAASSNNSSGLCCSIRWFVPLLAPLYFLLIRLLAARPDLQPDLLLLACFSAVLMAIAWWQGPWTPVKGWVYYPCLGLGLGSWGLYRWMRRRSQQIATELPAARARAA